MVVKVVFRRADVFQTCEKIMTVTSLFSDSTDSWKALIEQMGALYAASMLVRNVRVSSEVQRKQQWLQESECHHRLLRV